MQKRNSHRRTLFIEWRWSMIAALLLAPLAWGEGASIERVKAALEGNWRLEESLADGEILHPPQADGRMSLHDGVIMVLMYREIQGTRKSYYGYGTYALTKDTWTYGYDRYVTFNDNGSTITGGGAPFEGKRAYQIKSDGDKIIFDNDNGAWTFIFEGDALTYLGKGKPVRKWRRMPVE
jgi:hypothetical protein